MSDDTGEEPQASVKQITFNVKSSSDSKYVITVPEDISVLDLKNKLSTSEYADIAAERQRLIYSGRVLKNEDTLSAYKIKDGNTVHMVKGAASNARQNPASSGSAATPSNPAANVPSNFATGTGTDPLAGLTGARYAGFAQLPSAESFGADGGMGPPQGPDEMLRMLENPMFQGQMNEAMNNPHVIQMMQNSPMIRNNPMLRQMLENPEFRRTMMDPNMIRQSMQMQRMMGGGRAQGGMPAPGVTDTTPQTQQQQGQPTGTQAPPPNPFVGLGGGQGMGFGGQQGNPFAALFGGGAGGAGMMGSQQPPQASPHPNPSSTNPASPPAAGNNQQQNTTGNTQQAPQQNPQQPPNPFASMLGGMPQQGQGQQGNAFSAMAQQMMQNPEMMRMAMQMMGGMNGQQPQPGSNQQGGAQNPGQAGANPFASMFGPGAAGGANPFGGMFGQGAGLGGAAGGQPPASTDSRPPEEQYADQLRQLNEMGFFEFERNVRALRMAGGNVSGAIEMLLSGTI